MQHSMVKYKTDEIAYIQQSRRPNSAAKIKTNSKHNSITIFVLYVMLTTAHKQPDQNWQQFYFFASVSFFFFLKRAEWIFFVHSLQEVFNLCANSIFHQKPPPKKWAKNNELKRMSTVWAKFFVAKVLQQNFWFIWLFSVRLRFAWLTDYRFDKEPINMQTYFKEKLLTYIWLDSYENGLSTNSTNRRNSKLELPLLEDHRTKWLGNHILSDLVDISEIPLDDIGYSTLKKTVSLIWRQKQ